MKIRLVIILSFLFNSGFGSQVLAQKKLQPPPFGNVINFETAIIDSMRANGVQGAGIGISDTDLQSVFDKPWLRKYKMKSPIMLGVKLNPTLTNYGLSSVRSVYKNYSAYRISDQSDAILIALGITKNNINNFRYHVVVNDSAEVVHWSPIPQLEQRYGARVPYGFIGNFNYPGKQVLVEVVNIKDYRVRDGVIFDWRKNFKPIITNIQVLGEIPIGTNPYATKVVNRKSPHDYQIKYDSLTNAPLEIKFVYDSVSTIEIELKDHESIPYNAGLYEIKNGKKTLVNSPQPGSTPTIAAMSISHFPAGNYEIAVQPTTSGGVPMEGQAVRVRVIILPGPVLDEKVSLKSLLIFLFAGLVIIRSIFIIYRRRADIKLARSVQEKQTVSLKLRAIRSQLNPHFMFNALTSIQNLVNKKDIESANHYLSRFADLTRKVLNTGEQDLISLEDELKILDDYLQMEQLRFSFKYELNVDNGVNVANTEVPAMLLQPFVENAIKHGVAKLREKGLIKISVGQSGKNLVFAIADNGEGFKQKNEANGSFGLKLSEERIGLLNKIYKDQPTILNIQSAETGVNITITLTNWVS